MASAAPVPPWDDLETYNFGYQFRGYAVIVCNRKFIQLEDRATAYLDLQMMKWMFQKLGFTVIHYEDLSAAEMMNLFETAAGRHEDFKRSDCFVCAISTHGAELPEGEIHNAQQEVHRIERPAGRAAYTHHICGVNGRHDVLPTHTIIEMFSKIPALKGKPKLFFIQACSSRRSSSDLKYDPGYPIGVENDKTNEDKSENVAGNGFKKDTVDAAAICSKLTEEQKTIDIQKGWGLQSALFDEELLSDKDVRDEDEVIYCRSDFDDAPPPTYEPKPNPAGYDVFCTPCYRDCLVMFASPSGYSAFSKQGEGGWLIKSMYDVFKNYDPDNPAELLSELVRVAENMTTYETNICKKDELGQLIQVTEKSGKKSVPRLIHMLTKDIYFRRKAPSAEKEGCATITGT